MRRNIAPIVVVGLEQLEINDSATILDAQIDILTCRGVNEVQRLDRECKYYEVMSNADRIKNMSVEELAQTLFNHQFGHCSECAFKNKECSGNYFDDLSCIFGIKKWLLSASADNLCTEDSL